ncbi:hypothetical protein BGY98DRAFT_1021724, partial [Russula aff. rugulosa BPL654]
MGRAIPDNRVHILSVMVIVMGKARVGGRRAAPTGVIGRVQALSGARRDLPAPWGPLPNPMGIRGPALAILDR